jgi:general stress protein 26
METEQGRTNLEQIEELANYLKGMRFAMLTTTDPDGALRSRPMTVQNELDDGAFLFFTKADSGKVHSIETDQHVNLAFSDEDAGRYVSIAGLARIIDDRAKMREMWSPIYTAFFPDGVEDPELRLIRIETESAEVWEGPGGRVRQIIGMAKAAFTGDRSSMGVNKRMNLDTY